MEQRGDRLGLLVVHRRNKTRWTQFLLLSGKLSLLKTDGEISTSNRLWLRFELVTHLQGASCFLYLPACLHLVMMKFL